MGADAAGRRCTGIMDAMSTSESKKTEVLNARGSNSQSGRRNPADARIATHTATPMKGKRSLCSTNFTFTTALVATAATKMSPTIPTRVQSRGMGS